jgi:hypothetical protein
VGFIAGGSSGAETTGGFGAGSDFVSSGAGAALNL